MDRSILANYPPPLTPEQQNHLVSTVKDWAIHNGLAVRPNPAFVSKDTDTHGVLATNAPVTLFPSPFPKSGYQTAVTVQTTYNKLYANISRDEAWLGKVVEDLADADDFVANLWKVHLAVKKEGYVQPLSLGLFRSDYMVHAPSEADPVSIKQVEFNTISSSFGGLSDLVCKLHTELLNLPPGNPVTYPAHPIFKDNCPPENTAVATLSSGLAAAHAAYGPSKSTPSLPLCILFVVQHDERNVFDQHALSTELTRVHKIPVFRINSTDILTHTSIPSSNPSRPLIYTPPHSPSAPFEVSTIYLRAFYSPSDYPSPTSWTARTHLERSAAIKCPTILTQLAGCKKVQQVLAEPTGPADHLASFLPHTPPRLLEQIRSTFMPQYDLTTSSSSSGRGRALALKPETAARHVLKPQREGGGNNVYRDAIPGFLRSMPEQDWKGWILMELIRPPAEARNVALRSTGEVLSGHVVGELGVFGTILWRDDGEVLRNEQGGWLMRTKAKDSDEGGVAAGFSSLDSVLLV